MIPSQNCICDSFCFLLPQRFSVLNVATGQVRQRPEKKTFSFLLFCFCFFLSFVFTDFFFPFFLSAPEFFLPGSRSGPETILYPLILGSGCIVYPLIFRVRTTSFFYGPCIKRNSGFFFFVFIIFIVRVGIDPKQKLLLCAMPLTVQFFQICNSCVAGTTGKWSTVLENNSALPFQVWSVAFLQSHPRTIKVS